MRRTTVLLADDHAVVADGLRTLLSAEFELIGVVHDGRALIESAMSLRPDVIVTDLSMPLLNGLDAIRRIRADLPDSRIVVLTMHRDTQLAAEAFRAGVAGYVLKVSSGDELLAAVREVAQGRSFVTSLMAKDLISLLLAAGDPSKGNDVLTPRQREVLQLIAEGRTMKEVAALLHISARTAESHKYEIMQVLGVQNTAGLIQYAVKNCLLPD